MTNLPEPDGETLHSNLTKSEWYPAPLLKRQINAYDLLLGEGDYTSFTHVAQHIATKDLKPLFDTFLDLNNPNIVMNNTPELWVRYFDSGRLEFEALDLENNFSVLHLYDAADEDRVSGLAICNYAVLKWLKIGLLLCGASSANIEETDCRYKGEEYCEYEVTRE